MRDLQREPFHAADWLSLAAAPTFALMAVVTALLDGGGHRMACAATMAPSPLTGMVAMYVLMSSFHLTPWVKFISRAKLRPPRLTGWVSFWERVGELALFLRQRSRAGPEEHT